ncbi:MAG: hypothetical protein H6719_14375 [Sandaracinaceae bacterium]|nr:hypothetical protein [Sandaracinaceae bacterium]
MSHPDFILDKRVVARNMAKGIVTQDDLQKHLAKLPDAESNAVACAPVVPRDGSEEE